MEENISALEFEQLPYNLEAEQSVLGALLIDSSCISSVLNYLKPVCFYRVQHQRIFSIILNMFSSGSPIDFVTILDDVVNEDIFESAADAKVYLARLMEMVPSVSNVEVYCRIVQDKYYVRSLIQASREIISLASESGADAKSLMDMAEQRIYDIRRGRDTSGLVPISEVIIGAYDRLQKLSGDDRNQYLGISTGFPQLDTLLTGLNPSDLILIAARPAMGKSAFALNIAVNAARKSGKQVAIFSLEMSNQQLVERMLATESLIDSNKLRTGDLSGDEWSRLAEGAGVLSQLGVFLDDTSAITVAEMKAKLRRLPDLGVVVIDYLQLMTNGKKTDNRVQEVAEITRNLKIMAKELNVPVIALSQLSRGPDSRSDHRPMLSDLRESGSIEQDADIVMFLYRDYYYDNTTEAFNEAECIVAKNRHGETATIKLGWEGQFTRFTSGIDYAHSES